MAAVVVAGRHLGRQVDEAELLVDAHLPPDAVVAGVLLGPLLPGVVAELARLRDGVEDPEPLAGAHVVAADVALVVAPAHRAAALGVRGADDDDVAGDDRRGMQPDVAGDRDPSPDPSSSFRSTTPLLPNDGMRWPGLRVERDHPVAGRDVDDARRCGRRTSRRARGPTAAAALPRPRLPSSSRCIHSISPVAASSATTARREPAVV